jgi:alkylated DNA nucleotide flippase Atl1
LTSVYNYYIKLQPGRFGHIQNAVGEWFRLDGRLNRSGYDHLKGRKIMGYKKKTWLEKLADKAGYPKIIHLEKGFPCFNALHKMGAEAGDKIVLVNPGEVVELMKKVPHGRVVTITEICTCIANRYNVKGCCTLTSGIFIMTAANAAEEARLENNHLDIPHWRTLKADGFLNEKYPGGAEAHKALLEQEGLVVMKKGKKFQVEKYQDYLVRIY